MRWFILSRLLATIPLLLALSLLIFLMIHLIPGSAAAVILGLFPPTWAAYFVAWLVWRNRAPQQSMRRVRRAVKALKKEQTGIALKQLQEAHFLDTSNTDALYWLGLVLCQQQRWEEAAEALSLVAERLDRVRGDAFGGLASAKVTNEDNYVFQKFVRAVMGTNNVDHCARLCHSSTVAGLAASFGSGAMTNTVGDLGEADAILVTGSNTTESHPIIGLEIRQAVERGTKLLVFDPRRISLTRRAAVWGRQLSGTDVVWINGLMHVILRDGLHDRVGHRGQVVVHAGERRDGGLVEGAVAQRHPPVHKPDRQLAHHRAGGRRVGPDVELRGGRDVPQAVPGPAHHPDGLEVLGEVGRDP